MCLASCGKKFEYYIDDSALDGIKYTTKERCAWLKKPRRVNVCNIFIKCTTEIAIDKASVRYLPDGSSDWSEFPQDGTYYLITDWMHDETYISFYIESLKEEQGINPVAFKFSLIK